MLGLSDSVVMTAEGMKALQAELEQLETVARREIADRIKTAREWGDLKENSEYHDAKNDQAHLETKILRLRAAAKLPKGSYTVRVQAIDARGNLERAKTLALRS